MVAQAVAVMAHGIADLPEPPLIAQGLSESFSLTEIGNPPSSRVSKHEKRIFKGKTEIDGLDTRVLLLIKMRQRSQRLFPTRHCFPER
jgi:hypothetical protein